MTHAAVTATSSASEGRGKAQGHELTARRRAGACQAGSTTLATAGLPGAAGNDAAPKPSAEAGLGAAAGADGAGAGAACEEDAAPLVEASCLSASACFSAGRSLIRSLPRVLRGGKLMLGTRWWLEAEEAARWLKAEEAAGAGDEFYTGRSLSF